MRKRKVPWSIFTALACVVGIFSGIIIIRTITYRDFQSDFGECKVSDADFIAVTDERLQRFRDAIRLQPISYDIDHGNFSEILKLHDLIKKSFPLVHSSLFIERLIIANYSLLYIVKGTNDTLQPYMLISHLDVVPVKANDWDVDPFSADIKDGFIYGRGTLDIKQTLFGMLEALEFRLSRGERPTRMLYMSFGHDEEVKGMRGAKAIKDLLLSQGITFDFICDEGTMILNNVMPGIAGPIALIGIAQKGYAAIELSVITATGHSSMPPKETSIGILANAIINLEKYPPPNYFGLGLEAVTIQHLVTKMTLPYRIIMSNIWLFSPLLSRIYASKPSTNAIIRTSTAITIVNSGIQDNIIPSSAAAIIYHRIHPLESVADVLEYDKNVINDNRVKIKPIAVKEPSFISSTESAGYHIIHKSIHQIFNVPVAPSLFIANSDSIHYVTLSKCIYRFTPLLLNVNDLSRIHGNNERISVKNYEQTINFYYHLMINAEDLSNSRGRYEQRSEEF